MSRAAALQLLRHRAVRAQRLAARTPPRDAQKLARIALRLVVGLPLALRDAVLRCPYSHPSKLTMASCKCCERRRAGSAAQCTRSFICASHVPQFCTMRRATHGRLHLLQRTHGRVAPRDSATMMMRVGMLLALAVASETVEQRSAFQAPAALRFAGSARHAMAPQKFDMKMVAVDPPRVRTTLSKDIKTPDPIPWEADILKSTLNSATYSTHTQSLGH